jgi:hypothetical protein
MKKPKRYPKDKEKLLEVLRKENKEALIKMETEANLDRLAKGLYEANKDLYYVEKGRETGRIELNKAKKANVELRQNTIKEYIEKNPECLLNTELLFTLDGVLAEKKIKQVTFKILRGDLKDLKITPKVKLTEAL